MGKKKGFTFIIIVVAIVAVALIMRFVIASPFIQLIVVFFVVRAIKTKENKKQQEEESRYKEQKEREEQKEYYGGKETFDSGDDCDEWNYSTIITCEYCGCRVDTSKDVCCPHCGGPYGDNPEWKYIKAEQARARQRKKTMY